MSPERVADREIAGAAPSQGRSTAFGERLGAGLASPLGVILIVPGLVFAVGLFLTLIGQNALRESAATLGRDRLAEQTRVAAQSIASSLSHAHPLLDRMRELAMTWTPRDPPGPLAYELRGLMQGRPGVAYASVSFPDGTFRGLFLDRGVLRFVASEITADGTIDRRYDLVGHGELALYEEKSWTYDPRTRDFYRLAVGARHRVWTKPYAFFSSRQTGVTCAEPVFEPGPDGALRAVLTADFDVYALSRSLVATPLEGAKTLLYTSDGTLLAYPEGAAAIDLQAPVDRTIAIRDLHDPALDAFFATTRDRTAPPGEFLRFVSGTEPMLAMVAPVPELAELDWHLAALVSERVLFRERILHERRSLWVASGALLLALGISIVFARHVVRVRRRAARATDRAEELGSYQLVERLGVGGMGEVWRAEHRLLARQAAIKLIRAEKLAASPDSTPRLLQRFRREAQTLASLESRNTISLYDYGVTDDGTFFFVMELLDGVDLETLVDRDGPQPTGRVIHILLQALSSLAEAHDAGLVHRDVKPANLLVCRAADEVDIVKVLDFGIVQSARDASVKPSLALTPADLAQSAMTQAGHPLGTPAFMAPEQILVQPTDGRADLYGLGCVAVWLLSGQLLFKAENGLAMMLAHLTSRVALDQLLPPHVPPALVRVIERCLAKSPQDRPPDARGLAAELRAIDVAPSWSEASAREWWERQPARVPRREPVARGARAVVAGTEGEPG